MAVKITRVAPLNADDQRVEQALRTLRREIQELSTPTTGGGGGTDDHGALLNLGLDHHTQYHNDSRGDARYYTKSYVDDVTILSWIWLASHTDLAPVLDFEDSSRQVWAYTYDSVDRYREVPKPYTYTGDAFYENSSGSPSYTLSTLICTRGI